MNKMSWRPLPQWWRHAGKFISSIEEPTSAGVGDKVLVGPAGLSGNWEYEIRRKFI